MFFTNPQNDVGSQVKDWWNRLPLFTTFILFLSIPLCISSYFEGYPIWFIALNPQLFVESYYIWTLLTYSYQAIGLLSAVFSLYLFTTSANKNERNLGTVRYIFFFGFYSILLGSIFVALSYLLQNISLPLFSTMKTSIFSGLWPMVMIELVLLSNKDPDSSSKFMCCPCLIKSKYVPLIYFIIAILISRRIWEITLGIAGGYLHLSGFMNCIILSESCASKLERTLFYPLTKLSSFAFVDEFNGSSNFGIQRNQWSNEFTPFTGTGYRLGEDDETEFGNLSGQAYGTNTRNKNLPNRLI
ncbi:hypothetical protein SteCoe_10819 [Stentor coeruleus]|uniref:Peptidase S54 rhomboid domain-containing protein n=1 Tax=Stentor coeruleus TaxID=5963 RepID=A0A1R2CEV0_9CILI|nr:hypothetical protein SteCoe_10819 [Stentor coeruleus]